MCCSVIFNANPTGFNKFQYIFKNCKQNSPYFPATINVYYCYARSMFECIMLQYFLHTHLIKGKVK